MIRTETVPGFTSDMASINRVRLHYLLGGNRDGPPVLLWHGFLSTGYAWRKVMPALVDAGFAVLVPDMRGYGDSDKPAGTEGYDARALAEEFRALVREIGFGAGRPLTLVLAPLLTLGAFSRTSPQSELWGKRTEEGKPANAGDIPWAFISSAFTGLNQARLYPQLALWVTICRQLPGSESTSRAPAPTVESGAGVQFFGCGSDALCGRCRRVHRRLDPVDRR